MYIASFTGVEIASRVPVSSAEAIAALSPEIVDGLKEGEQVITGPYSVISKSLKGGLRVKVVPKEKLFEGGKN